MSFSQYQTLRFGPDMARVSFFLYYSGMTFVEFYDLVAGIGTA